MNKFINKEAYLIGGEDTWAFVLTRRKAGVIEQGSRSSVGC